MPYLCGVVAFRKRLDFYSYVRKCLSKHFEAAPEPVRMIIRRVKRYGGSKEVEQKKFSPQKAEKKKSARAD